MVVEEKEPLLTNRRNKKQYGSGQSKEVSVTSCSVNGEGGGVVAVEPEDPPPPCESIPAGTLDVLSANFDSLDYDICENALLLEEESKNGHSFIFKKNLIRWIIFFFIGVLTACIGVIIDISIDILSEFKYRYVQQYMNKATLHEKDYLYVPFLIWAGINVGVVLVGSFLVAFVEPVAGGSGIPQVKCYLNGIKIPNIVRVKTLVVKVIGVISTVVGGLAGGKEGPMIHAGAFVAAGISQGKSSSIQTDFGIFKYFREDHEKRDFVSGGAAAGVAAAFGAPIGGVLFSLEEGASFWNQSLTWRIFFASSVSTFTLNVILSAYHGVPGQLNFNGLLNFGHFDNLNYEVFELLLYILMGAIGGIIGSLYNYVNYKLTVFRLRYIRQRWLKVVEACMVALISCAVGMFMIFMMSDCKPLGQDPTKFPIQMYCADGEYNSMAAILLQVPEASVRSLFHDPPASHQVWTLVFFVIVYLGLSIWTYGLSVSAGIFIPCLLTGAAWGRLVGIFLGAILQNSSWVDPGKYALVGAAAQLGGVVRMTISLTVILIEATGNVNFGLPLMITLITAKWVGDYFCEGFYDIHIQLSGVPLLGWDPPPLSSTIYGNNIMHQPVKVFSPIEKVGVIVDALMKKSYNGFPVVEDYEYRCPRDGYQTYGKLSGLVLRSQLIALLLNKIYIERPENFHSPKCSMAMFRDGYPRYPRIQDIKISDEERGCSIDLRPFMNPSPYTVQYVASLPRIFRLFRALGLRHLVVINDFNEVVGIVTRKDLAKFRWSHHGKGIEILKISERI